MTDIFSRTDREDGVITFSNVEYHPTPADLARSLISACRQAGVQVQAVLEAVAVQVQVDAAPAYDRQASDRHDAALSAILR